MKLLKTAFMILAIVGMLLSASLPTCYSQDTDPGTLALKTGRQLKQKAQSGKDVDNALAKFQEAFELFDRAEARKQAAVALHEMAIIHEERAEHAKALELYEKSLQMRKEVNDLKGQGYCMNSMAIAYSAMSNYQKAMEHYQQALSIAKQVSDTHLEASVLQNIATVDMQFGKYKSAKENVQKALEIFKKNPNKKYEAGCLNDLGEIHRKAGSYKLAIDHYERALAINRSLNHVKAQSWNLNNIGITYLSLGKYQKAKEKFEESLEIKNRLGDDKGKSNAYNNIGLVYLYAGQYGLALENFQKGLALYRKVGNRRGESTALNNIGRVYSQWGKLDDALSTFQTSMAISNEIGLPVRNTKDLIAHLYMDKGDLPQAQSLLKDVNYDRSWGRYYLLKGEYDQAQTAYEKLLKLSEKTQNVEGLFTAYVGLGKTLEAKEDYAKAEQFYEKGMDLAEDIRSMLLPSERKNFFEVKTGGFYRWEPAKGLTRVRMKLNKDAKSIEASEAVRARSFADSISQRSEMGVSGVPSETLEREEYLTNKLANLKRDLSRTDKEDKPEVFRSLRNQTQEAQDDMDGFIEMLWKQHHQYAAVKYPRPVPLKQSAVRPDEYVIVYDVVEEGVGVKLVKGHEILQTYYLKWNEDELAADVNSFRHGFETYKLAEFDPELANRLYKKLLEPVMSNVPANANIVIIPDGILGILPFEALVVSGKATWKKGPYGPVPEGLTYVADRHPISYYQSITALTLLRKSPRENKPEVGKLLVIADPVFSLQDVRAQASSNVRVAAGDARHYTQLMAAIEDSSKGMFRFERLPETEALAASLGNIYKGKSHILTGLDASKKKFLKEIGPQLGTYNFVVFATHGLFSNKIPGVNEPFLALTMAPPGTDGFLKMSEVLSLKMNADLVALTACQTGLGNEMSGEGVMSMGRAFQFAGARCALMSLWSVAEDSSIFLVEDFFRQVKNGKSRLDALVHARNQLRQKGYEHPFFWAPFILVGEVS